MSSESINSLIGSFASTAATDLYTLNTDKLICIDTSRNRIGINTLDPSYDIHILDGKIFSDEGIFNDLEITGNLKLKNNNNVFDISESIYLDTSSIIIEASNIKLDCSLIFLRNLPDNSAGLLPDCLYKENGIIKIKI